MMTNNKPRAFPIRAILGFAVYLLIIPALLFISAGTLKWTVAWIYTAMTLFASIISRLIVLRLNPGLLQERATFTDTEGVKEWDTKLVPIIGLYGPALMMITAGLNHRFGWGPSVHPSAQGIGLLLIAMSFLWATWAMISNPFFSSVARIQHERGHAVIANGPYRIVRHPAYSASIFAFLAIPITLDAAWTYLPAILTAAVLILRTRLEDRMLMNELPGYKTYADKTRFRLFPGIW
jgi:protein-S-isoprenylcysteine O-methyltransferase Ste14